MAELCWDSIPRSLFPNDPDFHNDCKSSCLCLNSFLCSDIYSLPTHSCGSYGRTLQCGLGIYRYCMFSATFTISWKTCIFDRHAIFTVLSRTLKFCVYPKILPLVQLKILGPQNHGYGMQINIFFFVQLSPVKPVTTLFSFFYFF